MGKNEILSNIEKFRKAIIKDVAMIRKDNCRYWRTALRFNMMMLRKYLVKLDSYRKIEESAKRLSL